MLWIYARSFTSNLWFNGWQKLPVASLNLNFCKCFRFSFSVYFSMFCMLCMRRFWLLKTLMQMNSNSWETKQKQNKQKIYIDEDWVLKLNWKIEFFVLYNGHQNCFDKSLPINKGAHTVYVRIHVCMFVYFCACCVTFSFIYSHKCFTFYLFVITNIFFLFLFHYFLNDVKSQKN